MKCQAITKQNKQCGHSASSMTGCIKVDDKIYYVCHQHAIMHHEGKKLTFIRGAGAEPVNLEAVEEIQQRFIDAKMRTEELVKQASGSRLAQAWLNKEIPMFKIMLTGHRNIEHPDVALEAMKKVIQHFIDEKGKENIVVITGGAQGADRLWARAAFQLGVAYDVYVPRGYKENYKLGPWFDNMLANARQIHWTQKEGVKFHYTMNFKRNIDMIVDANIHVVCSPQSEKELRNSRRGGTAAAVKEMWNRRFNIGHFVHINPNTGEVKWVIYK